MWDAMLHSQSWHSWDFNSAGSRRCRGDKQRQKAPREKVPKITAREQDFPV